MLFRSALREGFFSEIYHPQTGLPYGGVQESGGELRTDWVSQPRQTWSATGYVRMLLFGLIGLRFEENRISASPRRIDAVGRVRLTGLQWRDMTVDIDIRPSGFGKTTSVPYSAGGHAAITLE